jgi:hypothetical protein
MGNDGQKRGLRMVQGVSQRRENAARGTATRLERGRILHPGPNAPRVARETSGGSSERPPNRIDDGRRDMVVIRLANRKMYAGLRTVITVHNGATDPARLRMHDQFEFSPKEDKRINSMVAHLRDIYTRSYRETVTVDDQR